jgi:starvation-inducible DNA-binding protein
MLSINGQPPHLYSTRIDLPEEVRLSLVQMLNLALAYSVDLCSQVKQAMWNTKGKEAAIVQNLLNTLGVELEDYADGMAERIAVLGGIVMGTVRTAATCSLLPEYPDNLVNAQAHALMVTERLAVYAKVIRGGVTASQDVEDAVTAVLYTEILRRVEKQLWTLETYLHP